MPKEDQYRHKDPNMPWKWMSGGNGGYRMYYNGEEVTASALERFLNQNHHDLSVLVDHVRTMNIRLPITKGFG